MYYRQAFTTEELRNIERKASEKPYHIAMFTLRMRTNFTEETCKRWIVHIVRENPNSTLAKSLDKSHGFPLDLNKKLCYTLGTMERDHE